MKRINHVIAAILAMGVATAALPLMADEATTKVGNVLPVGNGIATQGLDLGGLVVDGVSVKSARAQTEQEKKAIDYLVSVQGKGPDGKAYDTTKMPNADGAWMPEMGPAVT